ncbi:MAG: MFS transporter [SAR86 cluster bacterium]|jgi:Na+/melibiose symporter-like transporter|nr:MFS transporter [SAR86 cluster bacterium]
MAEQEVKAQGASLNTMFTYGIGTIAIGIKNSLLGTFLLLYFNQVLGLPAVLVASALAVALVVDAFSDPIVGIWSDRVRSRWGRRHPFIYVAIIPFALSYYFILQNPGSISTGEITESELFVRLLVLLIIMRLSMTFYEVPRGALQPELTKDYDQRNQISGIGMAFGWIGGAGMASIAYAFFFVETPDFTGARAFLRPEAFQQLAFWGGLSLFISAVISNVGLHKHIPNLHIPEERNLDDFDIKGTIFTKELSFSSLFLPKLPSSFLGAIIYIFPVTLTIIHIILIILGWLVTILLPENWISKLQKAEFWTKKFFWEALETINNRSWIVLFFAGCVYSLLVGLGTGAGMYHNLYFWQWTPSDIALFPTVGAISVIIVALLAGTIARGRDKKKIAVGIFLTTIITGPLPVVLRLLDPYFSATLFPANGTDVLWWIMITHYTFEVCLGSLGFIFIGSMTMEIVEDVQRNTGRREEGLLGTINSFIQKLIGAGGVILSGIIISVAGFDTPGATFEELTTTVVNKFATMHVILAATMPFISTLLILFYSIDRKGHLDNVENLGYTEES